MIFGNKDKDEDKKQDPGSERLWKDLNDAEMSWCCKFLIEIKTKFKLAHFSFMTPKGEYAGMNLNYCPRCGRRLA